jgi:ribose transport system substrate-binding protein
VVKRALDKGMAVVNIDNPLSRKAQADHNFSVPFVGPDNEEGAWMVGSYIRNKLGRKRRIFIIEGIRSVENAELRKNGFLRALGEPGDCELLAMETGLWHSDEAFNVVSRLLKKYGAVDAVLCANDKMALGALRALDLANLSGKTLIGGYDNIEAVRYEMEQGAIHATAEQHPSLMGELGVKLAVDMLHHVPVDMRIKTPVDLVTYESFGKKVALCLSDLSNPFFKDLAKGRKKPPSYWASNYRLRTPKTVT